MIPLSAFEHISFADAFSKVPFYIMLAGSTIMAVLCVLFFWSFVEYVFSRGDDAERAHAKVHLLSAATRILLLMIVWLIFNIVDGVLRAL